MPELVRKLWKWTKEHRNLLYVLFSCCVLLPVVVGFLANLFVKSRAIIILAALVGVWPDINSITGPVPWLGIGIGLSACAIFGIPTALGVVVTILLERTEKRILMSLSRYINNRDKFLVTEVWMEFRDKVKDEISEEDCYELVTNALKRAASVWEESSSDRMKEVIDRIHIPNPNH